MTRYEQIKPGLSLIFGKKAVSTLGRTVSVLEEHLDCDICPYSKECENEINEYHKIHPYEWYSTDCKSRLKKYLQEEIKS